MKTEKLTFHQGDDYAVIMLPDQTTDSPLASIYGPDVERFGRLFAAAPEMLEALNVALIALQSGVGAHSALLEIYRAMELAVIGKDSK